jgi:hypothetical protein
VDPTHVFETISSIAARLLPPETDLASTSRAELRHLLIQRLEKAFTSIEEMQAVVSEGKEGPETLEAGVVDALDGTRIDVPVGIVCENEWQALLMHCVRGDTYPRSVRCLLDFLGGRD